MRIEPAALPGVAVIKPRRFSDERGFFAEIYAAERYRTAGLTLPFVQDNHSRSRRGVVRGLHFQEPNPQGKLVQALRGRAFDVAVDIRRGSPHFGRWCAVELSDENGWQVWIPPGFAHGFMALSDETELLYKCTAPYAPECEHTIHWRDEELAIAWPDAGAPVVVSAKDDRAPRLRALPILPDFEVAP